MSTTPNDLFIQASRRKLRFSSPKGSLGADDLWDLSLSSLDAIAVNLDDLIQKAGKKSFLAKRAASTLELDIAFEIVKFVLETRVAENEASKLKADKESQKAFLSNLLKEKQMDEIKGLSAEEIQKRIEAL